MRFYDAGSGRLSIDGVPLSDEDIVLNCYSLIIGGDETSRLTMNDAVFTLAHDPGQWRALRDGRAGLDVRIEAGRLRRALRRDPA